MITIKFIQRADGEFIGLGLLGRPFPIALAAAQRRDFLGIAANGDANVGAVHMFRKATVFLHEVSFKRKMSGISIVATSNFCASEEIGVSVHRVASIAASSHTRQN